MAAALLLVAAAGMAVYAAVLSSVLPDVIEVVEDQLGDDYGIVASVAPVAGWVVMAAYGLLALVFLVLTLPIALGSRAARRWTFTVGFITLLVAAPLGLVAAVQASRAETDSDLLGELFEVASEAGMQNVIIAGALTMIAIVVALILLASRPVKDYIATRGR